MIRVLMVTSVFPRYDGDATPAFVRNLAVGIARKGIEVCVLAPHGPKAKLTETIPVGEGATPVKVFRMPYCLPFSTQRLCYEGGVLVNLKTRPWTRLLLPLLIISQTLALLWLTLRWRPDIIHSHSLLPQGFTAAIVSVITRRRHLTTSHGNDVFGLRPDGLMGHLKRWVLRQADAVTVNSSATEEAVLALGCSPSKIHRIPAMPNEYPPDPVLVAKIQADIIKQANPVIVYVGRMIEDKGVADLLEAMAQLRAHFPALGALFIGDGQDRTAFEAQAKRLGLAPYIDWAGWVPPEHVASWMVAGDVLVIPSRRYEAQGLVAVEAMLAGVPVVASRLGGLPDMIEDGVTGLLAQPKDFAALGKTLAKLLSDRSIQMQLTANARECAEKKFSREAITAATIGLIETKITQPATLLSRR